MTSGTGLNPDADAGLKQLTTGRNADSGLTFSGIPAITYNRRCLLVFLITGPFSRSTSMGCLAVDRKEKGGFLSIFLFMYVIQHCIICRPSESTVSEDAGIEHSTFATLALTARRSNHLAKSHPHRIE